MTCPKCKAPLQPGKAIEQTWTAGASDFIGDKRLVTFSAGGPGRLIDCLKCPACGRSVTK